MNQATSGKLAEEQAKAKWCPFTGSGDAAETCEASSCMAWQWDSEAGYTEQEMRDNSVPGFCGFVGVPYPMRGKL